MKTIGVISSKGGSGKTTLVINLAVAAFCDGVTVRIIDVDEQGSATAWGDRREDAPPQVEISNGRRIKRSLEQAAADGIELCIIDTPGRVTTEYYAISDFVLVPTGESIFDLDTIGQNVQLAASRPYALVLTRIPPQAKAAELEKSFSDNGLPVAPSLSNRKEFRGSGNGKGVVEFDPGGKAAREIEALYEWVKGKLV